MTRVEMEQLKNLHKNNLITAHDLILKDYSYQRKFCTLIYGYTCERKTFHVYLKDGEIHTVIYDIKLENDQWIPVNMVEINITSNSQYVPDKRVYPECCDYNFCRLLQEKDVLLPFTSFNDEREIKDFYGFTLEDFLSVDK